MPQSRRTHVLAHLFLIMWKQSTLHYGRREKEWSSSNVQLNNSCHLLARTRMDGWMMEDFLLYFTTLTIDRFIVLHFTCFKLFICSWLYLCPTHSTAQQTVPWNFHLIFFFFIFSRFLLLLLHFVFSCCHWIVMQPSSIQGLDLFLCVVSHSDTFFDDIYRSIHRFTQLRQRQYLPSVLAFVSWFGASVLCIPFLLVYKVTISPPANLSSTMSSFSSSNGLQLNPTTTTTMTTTTTTIPFSDGNIINDKKLCVSDYGSDEWHFVFIVSYVGFAFIVPCCGIIYNHIGLTRLTILLFDDTIIRLLIRFVWLDFRCSSETLCPFFDRPCSAWWITSANAYDPSKTNTHDSRDRNDTEWSQCSTRVIAWRVSESATK